MTEMIGGEVCHARVSTHLLEGDGGPLTVGERDALWRIFVEIGRCWGLVHTRSSDPPGTRDRRHAVRDSANARSSWLEFIEAKTTVAPSYAAEYRNAIAVVDELIGMYGEEDAFRRLFLKNGIPSKQRGKPATRLAHAKEFVVDEFIAVQLVAGGFKEFFARNYNGYIGGSRYNRRPTVRAYAPPARQA